MFYWVHLHHWKYGDLENTCYTKEELHNLIDMHLDAGWVVTQIKKMNSEQEGDEQ